MVRLFVLLVIGLGAAWGVCRFTTPCYEARCDCEVSFGVAAEGGFEENLNTRLAVWQAELGDALAGVEIARVPRSRLVAATARMMKAPNWNGMSERRLAALEMGLKMTKGEGFFGIPEGKPNPYMTDSEENLARGLVYLRETDLRLPLIDLMAGGRLKCPVRIFQSERDGIVRPENAKFLESVFPGSRVDMVPGAEHALPIMIPEQIDSAVAECLLV